MRGNKLLTLLVPAVFALLPLTAHANVSGLSVAPASSDPSNPTTRSYFIRATAPGETFSDRVRVSNGGIDRIDLLVSAVDGLTGQTSGAVYANREDPVRKAAAWVSVAVSSVSVAPGATSYVDFTVRVPADAQPGDHLAGIAFEDAHPSSQGTGLQVTTVMRAVVGVLIHVAGPSAFHATITRVSIDPLSDTAKLAVVKVTLGNDGRALGKPRLGCTLSGPDGYHGAVQDRQLDTVLPSDAIDYPLPWPDALQPGDYAIKCHVVGPDMTQPAAFEASYRLPSALAPDVPQAAQSGPAPGSADSLIAPWLRETIIGGLLFVLLMTVGVGVRWLVRRL